MSHESTIFRFDRSVPMGDVQTTLHLARLATSSLHGDDRVRQQAEASVDPEASLCRINTSREVGQSLALIFGGYVRREFGDDAVQIERVASMGIGQPEEVIT